jgi:hypothetical protein
VFEDNVDPALVGDTPDFIANLLRLMIDNVVGAELPRFLQLGIGTSSGDDLRAEEFCDLDSGAADPASGAEDQDGFARLKLSACDEHVPRGLEDERDRSSFLERKILRIRQAIHLGRANKFGAAAVNHVAEVGGQAALVIEASNTRETFAATNHRCEHNFLTHASTRDFRADLCDFSSDVAAGNMWKRDGNIRQSAADPQIEMIQSAGAHADENFIGAGLGLGDVDVLQNFGSTMLAEEDSLHDASELF